MQIFILLHDIVIFALIFFSLHIYFHNCKMKSSSYDGEFRMPLVLAQASPIFPSSCEGKLGIALE